MCARHGGETGSRAANDDTWLPSPKRLSSRERNVDRSLARRPTHWSVAGPGVRSSPPRASCDARTTPRQHRPVQTDHRRYQRRPVPRGSPMHASASAGSMLNAGRACAHHHVGGLHGKRRHDPLAARACRRERTVCVTLRARRAPPMLSTCDDHPPSPLASSVAIGCARAESQPREGPGFSSERFLRASGRRARGRARRREPAGASCSMNSLTLKSLTDIQAALMESGAAYASARTHAGWTRCLSMTRGRPQPRPSTGDLPQLSTRRRFAARPSRCASGAAPAAGAPAISAGSCRATRRTRACHRRVRRSGSLFR